MVSLPAELKPHAIKRVESEFKTKIIEFENGSEQRMAMWLSSKKTYDFVWTVLNNTELASLRSFFDSHYGQFKKWTLNDTRIGGNKTLRFAEDRLGVEKITAYFSSVVVRVREC